MLGRLLGAILVVGAVIVLAQDALHYINQNTWRPQSVGTLWVSLHEPSLNATESFIARQLGVDVWNGLMGVLRQPAWIVFGGLGVLLLILFRSRR